MRAAEQSLERFQEAHQIRALRALQNEAMPMTHGAPGRIE